MSTRQERRIAACLKSVDETIHRLLYVDEYNGREIELIACTECSEGRYRRIDSYGGRFACTNPDCDHELDWRDLDFDTQFRASYSEAGFLGYYEIDPDPDADDEDS